ncbi:transglycosylase SLT domain-containing protein [Alcaligenaceae bacterium A4P071]|nr:transglycosylase SLT domain-containing protein [Alcaligenaceae bacterium C4P045]MDQ2185519.1 transglycosylase SLT domain-containing protein [Alcaligenaceae bacterium A4P071]
MKHRLKAGRYQKSQAGVARHGWRRWSPLVVLCLAACGSVDAQQQQANATRVAAAEGAAQGMPEVAASIAPMLSSPTLPAVIAAREALQRKQWSVLGSLLPQADADLLGMYPQYWMLRYQLWNAPQAQWPTGSMERFMATHRDAYLADRLRTDWILAAARARDFDTVRRLGEVKSTSDQVACAQLQASHMGGRKVTANQAFTAFTPGSACWALLDQLVVDRAVQWNDVQPQMRDAVEQDKIADARRLAAYMFSADDMRTFDSVMRDPMRWLSHLPNPSAGRDNQEFVTLALGRLSRKEKEAGAAYAERDWAARTPKADMAWVRSQFALIAALNLDDRADGYYRQAGHIRMSEYSQAWKIRSALRQPTIDWKWVIESIEYMPKSQQDEPVWVYWRGRGFAALNQRSRAEREYARIADEYNFYGQLAAEELGRTIVVPPRPSPLTPREVLRVSGDPGIQRAVALFRLGWRAEAVPEWNFAIRDMNDRELLAAAEVARAEHIYDRVVNTSDRTAREVDFTQRYIAPFEGRVSAQAREISLDPAWVYGLIRQESRFISNARSQVGASGLMQLMPGTAKFVARKIGMNDFTPDSVNDFDVNTRLGTNYLNMVLQDLSGSQVLASAGYNAGPRRPHAWRGTLSHPVEGAIFAETIPFTETRIYVKNVMSNATYYAALFSGQPQSLKARLGRIVPQGNESTDLQ